jgi:hypothetical protein
MQRQVGRFWPAEDRDSRIRLQVQALRSATLAISLIVVSLAPALANHNPAHTHNGKSTNFTTK